MNDNNKIITDFFNSISVTEIGFAKVDNELPYAISIVIPLSKYVLSKVDTMPTFEYFHHYRTVNAFIDNALLRCAFEIEKRGYNYLCVGASQSTSEYKGYFSHKQAARLAGLGYIGKSALFISEKYGPAIRLGTILTDMPFEVGSPIDKDCGECTICRDLCPAMAIRGVNYKEGMERSEIFDAAACSNHMKKAYQHIGRGSVCGICISKCPKFR
ncbi:MAG: epoxyqueuosine reductase [Eubacteriales bacterium]|nr:epoxyqueuosine reductase [Eubacteriales bacterium]